MRRWMNPGSHGRGMGNHSLGEMAAGIGTKGNWRWSQLLRLAPALKASLESWWILPKGKQPWARNKHFLGRHGVHTCLFSDRQGVVDFFPRPSSMG